MRIARSIKPGIGIAFLSVMHIFGGCSSEDKPDMWRDGQQIPHPKSYVCNYSPTPLSIDGKLDDTAWAGAPWTEDFGDIEGHLKPAPRFRTRAKMLWTDENFIIGAQLLEPHIWGTLRQRDTVIFYDNDFEVFIDPDGDNHEYYEFEMNALNTVWDLFLPKPYRDRGSAVDEWNIDGLQTGVSIQGTLNDPSDSDSSWTVEIAMPWAALSAYAHRPSPPEEGDRWRVNFSRVEWMTTVEDGKYVKVKGRPEDNWVWSPQWAVDMHRPELWGYVQFTRNPAGTTIAFRDSSWEARVAVMRVYHTQRTFFEDGKRWAASTEELSDYRLPEAAGVSAPIIQTNDTGYVCTVKATLPGGREKQWHLSQDSRIWSE